MERISMNEAEQKLVLIKEAIDRAKSMADKGFLVLAINNLFADIGGILETEF